MRTSGVELRTELAGARFALVALTFPPAFLLETCLHGFGQRRADRRFLTSSHRVARGMALTPIPTPDYHADISTNDKQSSAHPDRLERTPETAASDSEQIRTGSKPRSQVTSGLFRFSVTQFLVALILALIAIPLLSAYRDGEVIVSISMTLVLISAVLAVGGGGCLLALTILLVLPAPGRGVD